MGCSPEDLPEAMNDREKWRERVRDIRATSMTWSWRWWWLFKMLCIFLVQVKLIFTVFQFKNFPQCIVPIKVLIQGVSEVFAYVNVDKFTKRRVIPNYFSISISSSSIWVIIIIVTYLDECAGPPTITPTLRAGVHWDHILLSHLISAVFEGFPCSWLYKDLYLGHVWSYCQIRAGGTLPRWRNYLHPRQ